MNMDHAPGKFPFPSSFHFRDDERAALEALFERTLFYKPFTPESRESLSRTRFRRAEGSTNAEATVAAGGDSPPSTESSPSLTAPMGIDTAEATAPERGYPGDAARYILLCRGANGIGKTRVFRQFRESAQKKKIPVYEVYHRDVEGIPFKPFLRAIREILRDHDQGAALQEKYRYGLQVLMPELYGLSVEPGSEGGPTHTDQTPEAGASGKRSSAAVASGVAPRVDERVDEADRVRIFDAITQLLLEVTTQKPLLMLVHDLHYSDQPTIELLDYIGRNLQLRDTGVAPMAVDTHPEGALSAPAGELSSGPEMDDFDGEGWRSLSRSHPQSLDLLGVQYYAFPPPLASPGAGGPGGAVGPLPSRSDGAVASGVDKGNSGIEADVPEGSWENTGPGQSSPRLMVLANYRGFRDSSHYLNRALTTLGNQPFAYHGELRAVSREGADRFIQTCLDGVQVEGKPLEVRAGSIDVIYEACEGFPSFMQELFRALYLREGGFAGGGSEPPFVWSGSSISSALAPHSVAKEADPQLFDEERMPAGRRHAILRLRLSGASPTELRVLQAMATARRPVTPDFFSRVLDGLLDIDGGLAKQREAVVNALLVLEERGIIESMGTESTRTDARYFFRLWDYTLVVEETIPAAEKERLHQRMGEEYQSRLDQDGDEAAYEIYYHLRRGLEPRASLHAGLLAARRFLRSFALEKARRVYNSLLEILELPEDISLRLAVVEQTARISMALGDVGAAADILRQARAKDAALISPEKRVELIYLEAEATGSVDPAKGLKVLARAPRLLKDENTQLGVRLQLLTARFRLERQDIKRAINFCLKGISLCQKVGDVPELGELYRTMASAFYRKGDYAHAVDNYQRALDVFERMGLKEAPVGTLDELGRVYLERGNYFRAARYLYQSLEIRQRQQDFLGLCHSYDELGRVYLRSGDYLKTIENLNRSLHLKERIGDFAGLNPTLLILGDLYFRLGRHEQSLLYFGREVENSQKLGDTRGLVQGLGQLGRVHLELGDVTRAEGASKQVSILATEFKLRSQEADGAILEGNLAALRRDWAASEKSLKFAAEVHGKLGHRRREISAYLDLADGKLARELYDESLKFASKGQIIADALKALDLQVRALTIKGNLHRFLKGGNIEKAREFLYKALELSQGLSDVSVLFQLFYSLAKVCHSEREFGEAANYYGKAELILKQVAAGLAEEREARFFDARGRKIFFEDMARFRKEALGRASATAVDRRESQSQKLGVNDRPIGFSDYKDLSMRVLRCNSELNQLHFHDRLLTEAVELTGANRGFILRVQSRQYFPVTFHGFGKAPAQHPDYPSASHLAQEAIRKGRSAFLATGSPGEREDGPDTHDNLEMRFRLKSLSQHSILVVPFMTNERIFGGVYLDKPVVVGQFVARNQVLLESFAQHVAVALYNRSEFETAIREPLTGFYTANYFIERLREAYRWFNLHGKSFTLLGFFVPALDDLLGEGKAEAAGKLARDLADVLPLHTAVSWGSPVLCALLSEADVAVEGEIAVRVRQCLEKTFGQEIPMGIVPAHNRYPHGAEIYFEMRRRLVPGVADQKVLAELRGLLTKDITLRDAKRILERHKIESTLRKTGGNITHAARDLGIHRPQLSNLLKKYCLRREVFENGLEVEAGERETEGH